MPGFPQQQVQQQPGMLPGQPSMPGQPPMPGMMPPGQQPPMGMPGMPPPMPGGMPQPGMPPPMPGMPQQPRPPMPTGMAPGMAPPAPAASKIDPSQIPRPLPYAIPTQVCGRPVGCVRCVMPALSAEDHAGAVQHSLWAANVLASPSLLTNPHPASRQSTAAVVSPPCRCLRHVGRRPTPSRRLRMHPSSSVTAAPAAPASCAPHSTCCPRLGTCSRALHCRWWRSSTRWHCRTREMTRWRCE